jgi:LmbE family N-acetylglucosaminyl deacetylase
MRAGLGARVVVLSPHLDDGVFSLGAAIARTTAANGEVKVVTVFANDPASTEPPSAWDAACGFGSVGEAATVRREEDDRACRLVGAQPVWLPFADDDHGGERVDAEI